MGTTGKTLPPKHAFITGWNARKHPFIWTKPADEILDKINRNVNNA
jgi:hypothetical protein